MPYEPHIDKVLNKIASGEETSEAEQLLKLQANRQLMNEHKKVSQMTDLEKQLYAELNQNEIEAYEEQFVKKGVETEYRGKTNVFFSPVASTVLDAFFTDGKN